MVSRMWGGAGGCGAIIPPPICKKPPGRRGGTGRVGTSISQMVQVGRIGFELDGLSELDSN